MELKQHTDSAACLWEWGTELKQHTESAACLWEWGTELKQHTDCCMFVGAGDGIKAAH